MLENTDSKFHFVKVNPSEQERTERPRNDKQSIKWILRRKSHTTNNT